MAKRYIVFKRQVSEIEDIEEMAKALEKIAAANVHYLNITSQKMKEYDKEIKRILCNLGTRTLFHPLFRQKRGKKLNVLLTSEKGLCGSLLNKLLDFFDLKTKKEDKVLVIGKKGEELLRERGRKADYFFPAQKEIPQKEDIKRIEKLVISQFLAGRLSEVVIFYPSFESLAVQNPSAFTLLPIEERKFREETGKIKEIEGLPIYEPNKKQILDYLIKEYLGLVFYQVILETKLSELSARTVAMEEAGENAQELIKQITLKYFREKREQTTKSINDLYSHHKIFQAI